MTGLDKIIARIGDDSEARCRQITEKAEREAQDVLNGAREKAAELSEARAAALRVRLENIGQAARSAAELKRNQFILKEKLAEIDSVLERALEILRALPNREYFEILRELALKNALRGKGVLHLNEKDAGRLPQNFLSGVNAALKARGGEIELGESVHIDSGFILTYGDIDISCTFSAIASAKRDALRDALNALLFA